MALTPEEEKYLSEMESLVEEQKKNQTQQDSYQDYYDMSLDEKERNIANEQLNLTAELNLIEHMLRGDVLKPNDKGIPRWQPPEDKDMILFSEHGVNKIMQTIQWYINKNLLLSNFDEDTINQKMEDFAYSLIDNIFMKYEKYFKYPTENECQQELKKRLELKATRIAFISKERDGIEIDKKKIYIQLLNELELDREISKIREQKVKDKLKDYDLIVRCIQDSVHATYNRALKGMERTSLRKHYHVSESYGTPAPQSHQGESKLNPLNWMPNRK